jgi:amidohydrolase
LTSIFEEFSKYNSGKNMKEIHKEICNLIDSVRGELFDVARYIYNNPEPGYEEEKASRRLVEILTQHNWNVDYPLAGLNTAFRATMSGTAERPHVAILAEYDALPELGHACGHNLIATAAIGAALSMGKLMSSMSGTISIIGTPAEEILFDSGKTRLVAAGEFRNVDAAMIVHPHGWTWLDRPFLAVDEVLVRFQGKSSHAASAPHLGINAFDALQLTFMGLSLLRQQLRQDARVHWGNLRISGAKNVIPDASSAVIDVRATDDKYTSELKEKVINCIRGAEMMTGCRADYEVHQGCRAMRYNRCLTNLFGENLSHLGVSPDALPKHGQAASTDMGNVSEVVPSIHPFYCIKRGVTPHTREFLEAANTDLAFEATVTASKAMAMTAVTLLTEEGKLKGVLKDFKRN